MKTSAGGSSQARLGKKAQSATLNAVNKNNLFRQRMHIYSQEYVKNRHVRKGRTAIQEGVHQGQSVDAV